MNTTAAIFFLILGQADGGVGNYSAATSGGGLAVIPSHYTSQIDCEAAGEAARANNMGLSFLSYTCVPGEVNLPPKLKDSVSKTRTLPVLFKSQNPPVGALKECLEVCEVQS